MQLSHDFIGGGGRNRTGLIFIGENSGARERLCPYPRCYPRVLAVARPRPFGKGFGGAPRRQKSGHPTRGGRKDGLPANVGPGSSNADLRCRRRRPLPDADRRVERVAGVICSPAPGIVPRGAFYVVPTARAIGPWRVDLSSRTARTFGNEQTDERHRNNVRYLRSQLPRVLSEQSRSRRCRTRQGLPFWSSRM